MAEIGAALTLTGLLYILSNQNGQENNNENDNGNNNKNVINNRISTGNYLKHPEVKALSTNSDEKFKHSNKDVSKATRQQNDKYFNSLNTNNKGGANETYQLLSGKQISQNDFNHNNQVPFFGSNIKGNYGEHELAESRLDHLQGSGSQMIKKEERAPLFKPQDSIHQPNGAPNVNNFLQSRVNPSLRIANIKPWEEQRVAPGLNKGFSTTGGIGFNNGMESRESWMPKTVDELRVETNPKETYSLNGHQGPANSGVKEFRNAQMIGKVEKNRPDTVFEMGENRLFTTTGQHIAPTTKSEQIIRDVNRNETSCSYYGAGNDPNGLYMEENYEDSKRQQLGCHGIANPTATGRFKGESVDFGTKSHSALHNNRSTTQHDLNQGPIQGMMKAVISPIIDAFRPTRKENVIGNLHPNGFAGTMVQKRAIEGQDKPIKTTNREMIGESTYLHPTSRQQDGYLVSEHAPIENQRDTTTVSYFGSGAPSGVVKDMSHDGEYCHGQNNNKSYPNRPNHGVSNMFNNSMNLSVQKNDCNGYNTRSMTRTSAPQMLPSNQMNGKVNMSTYDYKERDTTDRINEDLLTAFKNNPYTQSLESHA